MTAHEIWRQPGDHALVPVVVLDDPAVETTLAAVHAARRHDTVVSYDLNYGATLAEAVEYGAAHGALAMTTPGDTSMAGKAEVLALAAGGGARVKR